MKPVFTGWGAAPAVRRARSRVSAAGWLAAWVLWASAAGAEPSTNDRSWISRLPRVNALPPVAEDATAAAAGERSVNFSFDQVDIAAFVKLVGDLTGKRLVLAEGVKGKITVVSPRVAQSEVYPLFLSILESAGCAVVQEGEVFRVFTLPERPTPLAPVVGAEEATPLSGVVTKVFRLRHAAVAEVRKLLEAKVSGGKLGAVGAIEETNHLVVTDTADNIRRIEKLVGEIDQPGLARATEIVPLQYIGAEDLAAELNAALAQTETRAEQLRRRLPSPAEGSSGAARTPVVIASPHSNSLILVGTASQIEELRRLVKMMDVDVPSGRGNLNAIFLKYLAADEASKSLNALLAGTAEKQGDAALKRRIIIEASTANNALLVNATPGDFEVVRKLVEQLDQEQQQVHIEVLIAELTSGESVDFGVQMAALDVPEAPGDRVLQAGSRVKDSADSLLQSIQEGVLPQGLSVGVAHGTRLDAEGNVVVGYPALVSIDAIRKDSRFRIRSNPSLMAQNNQEASVSIVNEIPILKSTIQGGSGTARDVIQNIERLAVGIKLKLTPAVIPGGQVRMVLNPVIEAVIDPGPEAMPFAPTIARREVATTVTVADGDTIVIAGLTREDQTKVVKRVPVLGSIPLLGWLFRHTADAVERTNLLIFVTPRVVSDRALLERVAEEMEQKTGLKAHEQP